MYVSYISPSLQGTSPPQRFALYLLCMNHFYGRLFPKKNSIDHKIINSDGKDTKSGGIIRHNDDDEFGGIPG